MILVFDDFLENPEEYRDEALKLNFRTYDFPNCSFHGIALSGMTALVTDKLEEAGGFKASLSFFRKSPLGQVEPHFIHSDIDMGEWSAILYLNPNPPIEDGTAFWTHKATGDIESAIPHERSEEGRDPANFDMRRCIQAKFNRLLMFPSSYFHSRRIHDNWGDGQEARLTQVTFGKGQI
jgi:hypothetical protein